MAFLVAAPISQQAREESSGNRHCSLSTESEDISANGPSARVRLLRVVPRVQVNSALTFVYSLCSVGFCATVCHLSNCCGKNLPCLV